MNKKISLLLISALMTSSSFAISVKGDPSQINTNLNSSVKDTLPVEQLNKSGRINLVDLSSHLIIINDVRYTLSKNVKVYDGKLQARKFARFIMAPNKEIMEIWVQK